MELLKGADVVLKLKENLKNELNCFKKDIPHLAIIRVGEKKDDISYERGAKKRMDEIGIKCTSYVYSDNILEEDFITEFTKINEDKDISGILLLRPLPKHLNYEKITKLINPNKDIDGISPVNMSKVYCGDETGFAPCTSEAVIELLENKNISISGKRVVIVGRSLVVGKPLSMLFLKKNATVTICHSYTKDLEKICKDAQILVVCIGKAKIINKNYVGEKAVVIDVGINVDENNKLCGDVDIESLIETKTLITPVPGGIGPITTLILAKNVIKATKNSNITETLQKY